VSCVPFEPDYACDDAWVDLTPELQERATDLAWSTIKTLSGGRLGNCPVIVRPCIGPPCNVCLEWQNALDPHRGWVKVGLRAGEWLNCICGTPECSCERLCEIVMPGEVAGVLQVVLDGAELPLSSFRVDNGNRIVRTDGACWPSCQNMNAALGEVGTLGITYLPGIIPDSSALWAAGVLASEFAKACTGGKCRLPSSVTSIARQGISMTLGTMFEGGLTGIREVDAWLLSINPHGLRVPPMVWSPDVSWAKHRYQTPQVEVTP